MKPSRIPECKIYDVALNKRPIPCRFYDSVKQAYFEVCYFHDGGVIYCDEITQEDFEDSDGYKIEIV